MTVREAIRRADALRPNTVSDEEKCLWLAQLDGLLRREVVAQAGGTQTENAPGGETENAEAKNSGADNSTLDDATLLAAEPYSALYLYWLMAQTDLTLGELARYGNDMLLYNAALAEYAAAYRAAHMPRPRGQFRL
ncbi:MAG: hypothetical protein LKJ90_10075 [Faecalibacterium sp.]|nr:hypothetical protein [Faecalibacterium sp.]